MNTESDQPKQVASSAPIQQEMPFAIVEGEPLTVLPKDLYIPPDALEVFLEAFEGPLDLLLYLIKRQNLDILEIPLSEITTQYMGYIAMMETIRLEIAAEYLVMAAMLAEIKSRLLLPRVEELEEDEDDPRAELIRRLQEYERFKTAAQEIEQMPRMGRDTFTLAAEPPILNQDRPEPDVSLQELLLAFKDVVVRTEMHKHHNIDRETLSVRERMSNILEVIKIGNSCEFSTLFNPEEGRLGVVVTFLALLELCKESLIEITQTESFAPIFLKTKSEVLEDSVKHTHNPIQVESSEPIKNGH
jgi:segregation and condensation protein A